MPTGAQLLEQIHHLADTHLVFRQIGLNQLVEHIGIKPLQVRSNLSASIQIQRGQQLSDDAFAANHVAVRFIRVVLTYFIGSKAQKLNSPIVKHEN